MQTSIYGLSGLPFRIVFWIGVFVGIIVQYWIPEIGQLIASMFKYVILVLASVIQ